MEVREYLRDELQEEGSYGYVNGDELSRRLAIFDHTEARSTSDNAISMTASEETEGTVAEDDPSIVVKRLQVTSTPNPINAYVALPSGKTGVPGVLVVHENRGLTPYIREVARRLAALGYAAFAPDLLTPKGGADSFSDPAEAIAALGTRKRSDMVDELLASITKLAKLPEVDSARLGVIGFCFGGGLTWMVATKEERISAAVPFYGPNPPLEDVPGINASVLAIYGERDERINASIESIESAMTAADKPFEKEIYPDAQHAFHNHTNPDRYHPEAASAAWERATQFLSAHLHP